MTSKHTPGPWRVHGYEVKTPHNVNVDVGPGGLAVCNVLGSFEGAEPEEQTRDANARLIAAAPEMLEALRNAAGDLETLVGELPERETGIIDWTVKRAEHYRAILARVDGTE